jgi:PIN domain nuclease of toxin-antitoxin system
MRLLTDSHTLIWAVDDPSRLSPAAATALQDPANQLLVSAATPWEIAIKVGQNKLTLSLPYRAWMNQAISGLGLTTLPVTVEYANVLAFLPNHHRDPFDRLIIAQALIEGITVISADKIFDAYGVPRVW